MPCFGSEVLHDREYFLGPGTVGTPMVNEGNTAIRSRCWTFTLNNPEMDSGTLVLGLDGAVKFMFQLEEGDSGTPHFQGVVQYKSPKRLCTLKKEMPRAHWEKCKSIPASVKYCQKTEGRIAGPWFKGWKVEVPFVPRDWQREVLEIVNTEADDRTIHWFWEEEGNVGKTTLCKHLVRENDALYVLGKSADMKYAVTQYVEKNGEGPSTVLFDFPRTMEGFVSWEGMESIKNGLFFSGKYEAKTVVMDSPHVICFANFLPEMSKLSADRWKIKKIGEVGRNDVW